MAGVTIVGLTPLVQQLDRIEKLTGKRVMRLMDKYAEKIAVLASKYAPKKDGYLEDAIWVDKDLAQARDALGRFAQKRIQIGVHYEALGPGFSERGFDYATHIHEGRFSKVGPGSRAKAASLGLGAYGYGTGAGGRYVGPFFLSRAAAQLEPELVDRVVATVAETVR